MNVKKEKLQKVLIGVAVFVFFVIFGALYALFLGLPAETGACAAILVFIYCLITPKQE